MCGAAATRTNTTWRGRARSRRPRTRARTSPPPRSPACRSRSAPRAAPRDALAARRALITWPPPNPISTRFISSAIAPPRSSSRVAAGSTSSVSAPPVAFGCRKATRLPRIPIRASESISSTPASFRLASVAVDVGDPVGDVMKALAALGDEPADHGLGPKGAKQLDVPVADVEQHRLHALRLDRLPVRDRHPEGPLVEGRRPLQVGHREAHMIDQLEHGSQSIDGGSRRGC